VTSIIEIRLRPDSRSVPAAREALQALAGLVPAGVLEDLRLAASELVTNAIRHAGLGAADVIEMRVKVEGSIVRVEVVDPGPGFVPRPAPPSPDRESPWGLYLVGRVADRWGVHGDETTCVWFEIDQKGRRRPLASS
jgi:anti-sigma regulatory factor (Ser/Thr protein kinase)